MSRHIIYIDNDMMLTVDELKNVDGEFINDATVEATLLEADGITQVTGQTWPASLSYVAASDGRYRGVIQDGCLLEENTKYILVVIAEDGEGAQSQWEGEVWAQKRRF